MATRILGMGDIVGLVTEAQQKLDMEEQARIARELSDRGATVLYDDRAKVSPGVKFKDAELIGVPTIVVVGKGLASGTIEVKDRATGQRAEVEVDRAVVHIVAVVGG